MQKRSDVKLSKKSKSATRKKAALRSSRRNSPKTTGSRRKFLKMAGAVSAAVLLQNHAKGMVAPKFSSKWLAAIKFDDVNLDDYYTGCDCSSCDGGGACVNPWTAGSETWVGIQNPMTETQQCTEWCWAACAVMVANTYYGDFYYNQCDLVSEQTHASCCDTDGYSPICNSDCNKGADELWGLAKVGGHNHLRGTTSVDFCALQNEVCCNRLPVLTLQASGGDPKHAVVCTDVCCDPYNGRVFIYDPAPYNGALPSMTLTDFFTYYYPGWSWIELCETQA